MQKIKVEYRKGEEVKFISHRDLMRGMNTDNNFPDVPPAAEAGIPSIP